MTVSVIQLTYNNAGQARQFLPSVERLVDRPEVGEWIILDNGSTDGTLEELHRIRARCPKLRLIASKENLGCGGGRNVAWREAAAEFVLSLDSDVEVSRPDVLPQMLEDIRRPGIGIVGEHGGWIRRGWDWTVEAPSDYVGRVPIVCGFAQLFSRELVTDWVQRPEYGPYWLDDSEFSLQIQSRHGVVGWIGDYGLVHQWSHTNGRDERIRRAAWSAFRSRWRPAALDVIAPTLPARRQSRSAEAAATGPGGPRP